MQTCDCVAKPMPVGKPVLANPEVFKWEEGKGSNDGPFLECLKNGENERVLFFT